jgi:tRNA-dihydrouridine synthase B
MVAMAARVVRAVSLPVTVKTRIGLGPEERMPIRA